MNYCSSETLLIEVGADNTDINKSIAKVLIKMYIQSITFTYDNVITEMKRFLTSGSINFTQYNIRF